jgi:hypothetical protein
MPTVRATWPVSRHAPVRPCRRGQDTCPARSRPRTEITWVIYIVQRMAGRSNVGMMGTVLRSVVLQASRSTH